MWFLGWCSVLVLFSLWLYITNQVFLKRKKLYEILLLLFMFLLVMIVVTNMWNYILEYKVAKLNINFPHDRTFLMNFNFQMFIRSIDIHLNRSCSSKVFMYAISLKNCERLTKKSNINMYVHLLKTAFVLCKLYIVQK